MSNTLTTRLNCLLLSIDRYLSSDNVHEDTEGWTSHSRECDLQVNTSDGGYFGCQAIQSETGATNVYSNMKIPIKIKYQLHTKGRRCKLTSLIFPNGRSSRRKYDINVEAQKTWYNSIVPASFSPYLVYWATDCLIILPNSTSSYKTNYLRINFDPPK